LGELKMKNKIYLMVLASLLIIFSACSNNDNVGDASGNNDDDSKITVGVSLLGTSNENIVELQNGIEEKAEELDVDVRVTDANGVAIAQLEQIDNYIVVGVVLILYNTVIHISSFLYT